MMAHYGLGDVPQVSDPDAALYRAFGLRRFRFRELLSGRVLRRGAESFLKGHFQGKSEGDVQQMPGVFLVHKGKVLREFRHETVADRPDYQGLACPAGR